VPEAFVRLLCVAAAALILAACALRPAAPVPDAGPAAEVLRRLAQEMLDALPHDPAPWQRYVSERAVYVSEAGDIATKAELLEGFRPFPPGLSGSLKVQEARVEDFGDLATLVFEALERQGIFGQEIEVRYLGSQTWRREDGRWRLVLAHNAVRARDPPATPGQARRLRDFAGTYALGAWRLQVEVRDGTLAAGTPGGALRPLIAVGDNVFVEAGHPLAILRIFVRGSDGRVAKMIQRRKFADVEWTRLPRPSAPRP
jgi:hypothetical protein